MKTFFISCLFLFSSSVLSDSLDHVYISKEACPFEGCSFGQWDVKKETKVYTDPSINSTQVGILEPGTTVNALTGEVHVVPGQAKITGEPYKRTRFISGKSNKESKLDKNDLIYILDDVGEGRTRIYQNGNFYITKIATSENQCIKENDLRRCWVEVLKEPNSSWWVKIEFDGITGWILAGKAGNVLPINLLN